MPQQQLIVNISHCLIVVPTLIILIAIFNSVHLIALLTQDTIRDSGAHSAIMLTGLIIIALLLLVSLLACFTKLAMSKHLAVTTLFCSSLLFIPMICAGTLLKLPVERPMYLQENCQAAR